MATDPRPWRDWGYLPWGRNLWWASRWGLDTSHKPCQLMGYCWMTFYISERKPSSVSSGPVCWHLSNARRNSCCCGYVVKDQHTDHIQTTTDYITDHHKPTPYRPHTNPIPTTYRPHTDHIPTPYRPHTDHTPTTCQPHTDHIPTTYWPHTNHTPTTCQPHTDHIPTTYRPHTNPILTTYRPHTDPILTCSTCSLLYPDWFS